MKNPNFRDQQRILVQARLLGALYLTSLVPTSLIFDQLHHFVNFGHEIPPALRQVSEKYFEEEKFEFVALRGSVQTIHEELV